jgi:hypothetical protein
LKKSPKLTALFLIVILAAGSVTHPYSELLSNKNSGNSEFTWISSYQSKNLNLYSSTQERITIIKLISFLDVPDVKLETSKKNKSELLPSSFLPLIKERDFLTSEFATST